VNTGATDRDVNTGITGGHRCEDGSYGRSCGHRNYGHSRTTSYEFVLSTVTLISNYPCCHKVHLNTCFTHNASRNILTKR